MQKYLTRFNFYKFKFFLSRSSYEEKTINPIRDWNMNISFFFMIIIVSALYAYYVYYEIDNNRFVSVDSSKKETEIKINTTLLNKIVGEINDKSDNFKKIRSVDSVPADPSL